MAGGVVRSVLDRGTESSATSTRKRGGGSGPLERVTVNLVARASRALQMVSELTGDTKTGGRHPERAGVGRPAAGAVRLVEAGQAAGRGRRLHGDVASLGVHYQGRPRRVARAAGRLAGHGASAGRRAGLTPVSRATSATSSSS